MCTQTHKQISVQCLCSSRQPIVHCTTTDRQTQTHTRVHSLLTSICHLLYILLGASERLQVGGTQAFLAASVRPASVHSALSIPCQLVALRHILCNTQETSCCPPTPAIAAHHPMQRHQEMAATTPYPLTTTPSPDKSLLGLSIIPLTAEGRQLGCISLSSCTQHVASENIKAIKQS